MSQVYSLALATVLCFALSACKLRDSSSGLRGVDCDQAMLQALEKRVVALAPEAEQRKDLLAMFKEDASEPDSPASLQRQVAGFDESLKSCAAKPAPVSGSAASPQCAIGLFARSVMENAFYGMQKITYAPFYDTLKFKKVEGEGRLFVKRRARGLIVDPRQDYVIDGTQNRYHWTFRKGAGDLHPSNLLKELTGKAEIQLSSPFLGMRGPGLAGEEKNFQIFKNCSGLTDLLEKKGYLIGDLPKGGKKPIDINYMRIVDPARIEEALADSEVLSYISSRFGANQSDTVLSALRKLMLERANPAIKNREITAESLTKMGIDMPYVTLFFENGQSYVQLLDHHRIYGAQGLGMSIEVNNMWGINSFN